jgi:small ligand-binding sensory domain FIST
VISGSLEEEERPALGVLALGGVEAEPFLLRDLAGVEDAAGVEVEAVLGRSASERDLVVLLADSLVLDPQRLLRGLDETLGPATLVGAGAALGARGRALTWSGREVATGGASGLALRLARPARTVLTQGCRPITEALCVTRTEGRWILELDGRPALDVYREVAREPLAADLRRAAERLVAALPRPRGPERAQAAGYVARSVAGFAPERGAFALVEELRPGARIRLALRDAGLAREDLKRVLDGMRAAEGSQRAGSRRTGAGAEPRGPVAGIYLCCSGRGRGLFEHAGLESAYVAQALEPAPVGGMFGAFPFGPVAGATELLSYAGVLALLG